MAVSALEDLSEVERVVSPPPLGQMTPMSVVED